MTDRRSFLERVARATGTAALPPALAAPPAVTSPQLHDVDLAEMFSDRLAAVDGETLHVAARDAADAVLGILRAHGVEVAMAWNDDALPVTGVATVMRDSGIDIIEPVAPLRGHATHNPAYAAVDAGVTGAVAGLAESGSIVVRSARGRARMASLVGRVHVAMLERSRLHRSLTDLVVTDPDVLADGANVVVITGPSRTGDIEQNLNLGVHGPRHLHVVLIEDM